MLPIYDDIAGIRNARPGRIILDSQPTQLVRYDMENNENDANAKLPKEGPYGTTKEAI